ncbi:DNA photolyase family protein [Alphaproteobacteria bacterium]|nr:DNA photolyase family protein [Alphaproteobacteria bacterium]MDC0462314.1 DNA photolyase family protein [Alphaproteobacteria bacterium]
MKTIMWFRQDLRLTDNPALLDAVNCGTIIPIYILDDSNAGPFKIGAASRVWLHNSLSKLNTALNGNLKFFEGSASEILLKIIADTKAEKLVWTRCYEPWRMARDTAIKNQIRQLGVEVKSFSGSLLWEPHLINKPDGTHYRVFTPFYQRGCLSGQPPRKPLTAPAEIHYASDVDVVITSEQTLDELNLLPSQNWYKAFLDEWNIGEEGAQQALDTFLMNGISSYKLGRNIPSQKSVSRLSPRFHFGEISPNQAWYAAQHILEPGDPNLDSFLSELGWREFSHYLNYHYRTLADKNLNPKFDSFAWINTPEILKAWQQGITGYPIVDAGMRELYSTGYMHNRVRMIVGSFLVKNLLQHWHHGRDWFFDCLVDADLCVNSASWQWIAGCGADAAPYFRIFNPVTQGEKFDSDGIYTRKWVPELINLPNKFLFCPWQAPPEILKQSGIELGKTYPNPIINLADSRARALEAFSMLPKSK